MRLRNFVNIFACEVVAGDGMRRRRWTLSDVGIMFRRVCNVSGPMNCSNTAGEDEDESEEGEEEEEDEEEESAMGEEESTMGEEDEEEEDEGGGAGTASGADDNDANIWAKSIQSRTDGESESSDGRSRVVSHQH